MNLFDQQYRENQAAAEPLAARIRPRTLHEFVGQPEILGPGKLLRRLIERDELTSAIFWGPPGCGKSTLAAIIANETRSHFETFSAVTSGIAEVRKVMEAARERVGREGRRTVLFIDEIHRFNRAQQDAFLPYVEAGTIVLLGATTENPFFSINAPLLSRARVFRFEPLTEEEIETLLRHALTDRERGFGERRIALQPQALQHLVVTSNGDARRALNALELAVYSASVPPSGNDSGHPPPDSSPAEGDAPDVTSISLAQVEAAMQQRAIVYDTEGDSHYDTISAFIKSMRGSDVDAALYWLAKMIKAGEDPRFIARRLVILASEDIGNADPMGLVVATAAAHAVEYVGMPEAQLNLAQATVYLAAAPKSNASYIALQRAMEDVESRPAAAVPLHLRDASYRSAARLGHGSGYKYPHEYPGHFVEQEYLPPGIKSQTYYQPADTGREKKIRERMEAAFQPAKKLKEEGEPPLASEVTDEPETKHPNSE